MVGWSSQRGRGGRRQVAAVNLPGALSVLTVLLDQQLPSHLGRCEKCRIPGPTPDPLSQILHFI